MLFRTRTRTLPAGTRVRFVPGLCAPAPAPRHTYTITSETTPFTNVRPSCISHPNGCPGPWYLITDDRGRPVDGATCHGEIETA